MDSTLQENYEMLETVSNHRLSHGWTGEEVSTANQPLPQLFYAQFGYNNPIKKDEDKDTANPQEEWSLYNICSSGQEDE